MICVTCVTEEDKFNIAMCAWLRYFIDTERFDRQLRGTWSKHDPDVWLPFDNGESCRHAMERSRRLKNELSGFEIDEDTYQRAKTQAARYSYIAAQKVLNELLHRRVSNNIDQHTATKI